MKDELSPQNLCRRKRRNGKIMIEKPVIINIINFIRGVEPREEVDLYEPVEQQLKLLNDYNLRGTFLLQYDALINNKYIEMLKNTPHEIGCWLEVVEPMCERAGIKWRGRFPWDWHSHVGFTVGYTVSEREKLIDVLMEEFKDIWGVYPESVGSWMIDAHSLSYMSEKYKVSASCNCKDQWGTDGYTLWGGYYGQAYYPSKHNAYAPAQNEEMQINIPIFKMLGSDPIYQYDAGMSVTEGAANWQHVITLEPVYMGVGGGVPRWTKWFLDDVLCAPCSLAFGYAQVGQENSFGWPAMEKGLINQIKLLSQMSDEGRIRIETLASSSKWYRSMFKITPNAAITALSDWKDEDNQSVWFCSNRYRINFLKEKNSIWIRDLTLFDDNYKERYMNDICDNPIMIYDNLPVTDGNRWSGNGIRAGWRMFFDDEEIRVDNIEVNESNEDLIIIISSEQGMVTVCLKTNKIFISSSVPGFNIRMLWGISKEMDSAEFEENKMMLHHESFDYCIKLEAGIFRNQGIITDDNQIIIDFS